LHNEELALKALPQGASDYVIKNYLDADLLQRTIRSAIERKHTRNALEEQTRILQSILNSILDGVIVANQEGEWLLINPAAKKVFGFAPNHDPSDGWPDHHDVFMTDGLTPYPEQDLPLTRARRGEIVKEQELFIRPPNVPDGVVVNVNATPLRDENGSVIGGVAVFRDVTVRRLAEEQIRQLRAVLE
jgi:PAS domain-containing protein